MVCFRNVADVNTAVADKYTEKYIRAGFNNPKIEIGGKNVFTREWRFASDDNEILVTARRYRADQDLGLWTFRYGPGGYVESRALSHVFHDDGGETIQPTIFHPEYDPGDWEGAISGYIWGGLLYSGKIKDC